MKINRRLQFILHNLNYPRLIRRLSLYAALVYIVGNGYLVQAKIDQQNANLVLGVSTQEENYQKQLKQINTLRTIEHQVKVASEIEVDTKELNDKLKAVREKVYNGEILRANKEIISLETELKDKLINQYRSVKGAKEQADKLAAERGKEIDIKKSQLASESSARKQADKLAIQLVEEIEELKKLYEQDLKDMEKFTKILEKDSYGSYERKQVSAGGISYWVDIVTVNLGNPNLRIITDTATSDQCVTNCPTKSVLSYVSDNGGFAGVSGSYFCPVDYGSCASTPGLFPHAIYNSRIGKYFNGGSGSSMIAFDKSRNVHLIDYSVMPYSKSELDKKVGAEIVAAIANVPFLTKGGALAYNNNGFNLDYKQREIKTRRAAIGRAGNELKIVVTRSATTPEMAKLMLSLGINDSLELDGGGSTSLIYNGDYKVGPGRNMPTAIVFAQ